MSLTSIYLNNLAKRVMTDGKVSTAEIVNAPKLIDKSYGDGDGGLDWDDVTTIASDIGSEIAEKAGDVVEFLSSLF